MTHAKVVSNTIYRLTTLLFHNLAYADVTKFPVKGEYVYCSYDLPLKNNLFNI